ncbi:MAG: adenylosuccinate lyase [Gammaproteobacteria bacterium]|nr:adenylosuccinate lyase [Gammaproteobacteria bacterium]
MLTAISPLDGRYCHHTEQLRTIVSEYGLIFYRLSVEIKWLALLANNPQISEIQALTQDEDQFLNDLLNSFNETEAEEVKKIEKKTNHDVKAIEYYLREKLEAHTSLKRLSPFIHFACTSEDINNLAYAIMVKKTRDDILIPSLNNLIQSLDELAKNTAECAMLSRTHGQPATPTTLGKEFKNFSVRLSAHIKYVIDTPIVGKCNGAVGNYNAHCVAYPEIDWLMLSKNFVESLDLQWNAYTTQIEPHDFLAQLLNAFNICHTILIDFSRDMWGYIALDYFSLRKAEHEVGSSTMPHKINPIDFENAEGNLGLSIALATHLSQKLPLSRWQRDLTDSTVLRNLGSVFGYAIIAYTSLSKGLGKLIPNTEKIKKELNQHWEILAEPIQTVMRRYGINDAYEQLKNITRGEAITENQLRDFIKTLEIPEKAKKELQNLTPESYLGLAIKLAKE